MANKLLEYFKGDELASNVFKSKYAQEEDLTPDDMHKRMAKEFAKIEYKYQGSIKENKNNDKLSNYGKKREYLTEQSIYELFKDFKYIVPQGRIMAGLGVYDSYRSLSNCLRLPPPKDSYSSITYVDATLVAAAKKCGAVVTAEEHQILGGLGGAVSELLAKTAPTPIEFVGMKDTFGESGEPSELLKKYEMTSSDIIEAVLNVIKRKNRD